MRPLVFLLPLLVCAIPSPPALIKRSQIYSATLPHAPPPSPVLPPRCSSKRPWQRLTDAIKYSIWGGTQVATFEEEVEGIVVDIGHTQAPPHTQARYSGDVVLRFNVSSSVETKALADAADTLLLDIWGYSHNWVDLRLPKDIVAPLLGLLPDSLQHAHTPLLKEHELAQAIYDTYPTSSSHRQSLRDDAPQLSSAAHRSFSLSLQPDTPDRNIFFSDYQPLSVIDPWMRLLASLFTSHVRRVSIGLSSEGRDIPAVRVGVHPTNTQQKTPKRKTILVTGGLHAREWISTSTVNYLTYTLITGYGKNPTITRLLENFDFVLVPTINPDGYVYTWDTDRLWRKNRQETGFRFCQGIDLDRSFGFQWDGLTTTVGNPCSESYAGESAFQAVEAKRLADWVRNETEHNNVEFVGFLDLHSYSQEILYPYSYSCDDMPAGLENLEELAIGLEKAIRISHGHEYEVMPACEGNVATVGNGKRRHLWPRMEAAGGSALDYFYHETSVHYAYQIKLRDKGTYGFLLPKENIIPTGKEITEAVLYFGNFLTEIYSRSHEAEQKQDGEKTSKVATEQGKGDDEVRAAMGHDNDEIPEGISWDLKK